MPSSRDPQEPQDPIEDDDLIGAADEDADEADEADDDEEDEDDDILDEEEDDELDEDDEDENIEEETDEEVATMGALTGEVGSEGGSPGETVRRTRSGPARGSESTTTHDGGRERTRDIRDEKGVPVKGTP